MRLSSVIVQKYAEIFCDWITITQTHLVPVPVVHDAVIQCIKVDGELDWSSVRGFSHTGTFDTRVLVSSNGSRVTVSGNVGRHGRPDNVFGFGTTDVIELASDIAQKFGLPRFTKGIPVISGRGRSSYSAPQRQFSGATVSRLDMTRNFSTDGNASDYLYWVSTQKLMRGETERIGSTVYFGKHSTEGEGGKFAIMKAYDKAAELKKRYRSLKRKALTETTTWHLDYLEQLIEWCDKQGIVRCEVMLKQRYLTQRGLRHIAVVSNERMLKAFHEYENTMIKRITDYADIRDLKPRLQGIYHAYMRGENIEKMGFSRATFFRYRKELLPTGIDIFRPLNVTAINVKPRFIDLKPVAIPDFYYQPQAA